MFRIDKFIQKPKAVFVGNREDGSPIFEKSQDEMEIWIEDYEIKEIV